MAVSRVGSTSGVDTGTLPSHQAGDLIVVYTFRDGSATIPTLPAGYTSLGTTTTTTITASRLAYKFATSSSETLGTWTNATALIAHVYRGAVLAPNVGTGNPNANANSAYAFAPLTMYGPGTSWVAGFFGHVSTDTTLTNMAKGPWTGNTVVNYSDATNKAASFDTNGAIPGWPTLSSTNVGGTVGGWATYHLEICDATMVLSTPVARAQTGSLAATHTTASFTPLANETLFVAVSATHGSTVPAQPTISDSIGLTWTEIDDTQYNTGSSPYWRQRLFWANVGGSPASMTITGASASATGVYVNAVGMNGVDTASLTNKNANTNSAGDPSTTFPLQPHPYATALFFACGTGAVTATPPAGYTELFDGQPQTSRWIYAAYDPTVPTIGPHAVASTNTFSIGCEIEVRPTTLPDLAFRALVNPTAVASGNLVFTEPTGTAQGDLLVATITYRANVQFTAPAGWTIHQQDSTGADTTAANGTPGGLIASIVRGASAPDLTFVRTAGDVAFGTIAAYTPKNLTDTVTFDTSAITRQGNVAAISLTGITTTAANELIVGFDGSGRALGAPEYDLWKAATSPSWFSERSDIITATGADASHCHFDGISAAAGATGAITATCVATNVGNIGAVAAWKLVAAGSTAYTMPAAAGAYDLTGNAVALTRSYLPIAADTGAYTLAGTDVALTRSYLPAAVGPGAYTLSGTDAILTRSYLPVTAGPGTYSMTGVDVALTRSYLPAAVGPGVYTLAGVDVALTYTPLNNYSMPVGAGSYTQTGNAVLLQYAGFDTFSDETGAFPSGWTQRYSTANTTITGQAAAPGVAQIVSTTAGGRRALSFNEVPADSDIEAMTSASTGIIGTSQTLMGAFICGASPGSALNTNRESQYLAGFAVTAGGVVQYILKKYVDNGTSSTITDIQTPTNVTNFTVSINTFYRIRLRKSGSTVMMRAWPAASAEPSTWDLSGTDGSPLAGGWTGCFYFPASTGKFDFLTFATNGATAPEPPIPGAYGLTVETGSYTLSGQNVAFQRIYVGAADPGAYTVNGQPVGLTVTRFVAADAGAYTLAGQAATLTFGQAIPVMPVDPGAYTLTGQPVAFPRSYQMTADPGAYILGGQPVSFGRIYRSTAAPDTYILDGQAVALSYQAVGHFVLGVNPGDFQLIGNDVATLRTIIMPAAAGSYGVAGQPVNFLFNRATAVGLGAYALAGQPVAFARIYKMPADAGAYILAGQPVGIVRGYPHIVGAGSYDLTGQPVLFRRAYAVQAGLGVYNLTGQPILARSSYRLAVGLDNYLLNGLDVTLRQGLVAGGQPVHIEGEIDFAFDLQGEVDADLILAGSLTMATLKGSI